MITKDEIQELLHSTETYRVERTTSTTGVGQVQTDLKANGNQHAEFNVNLITAFKVEVKVAQSYVTDNGGNVGDREPMARHCGTNS